MSDVLNTSVTTMDVKTAAERWKCAPNEVRTWCKEGAIEGACKPKNAWTIPVQASRPLDKKLIKEVLWQLLELSNGSASTIDLTPWGVNSSNLLAAYLDALEDAGFIMAITDTNNHQAFVRLTVKGLYALGRNTSSDEAELPQFLSMGAAAGGRFAAEFVKNLW